MATKTKSNYYDMGQAVFNFAQSLTEDRLVKVGGQMMFALKPGEEYVGAGKLIIVAQETAPTGSACACCGGKIKKGEKRLYIEWRHCESYGYYNQKKRIHARCGG